MDRLVPSKTLIAVIDIQEALAAAMPPARMADLTRGVGVLLSSAQLLSAPVLATEQYPRGLKSTIAPVLAKLDELGIARIEKTAFSACDAPEFANALAKAAPQAVVVVGMETHVCVYQTVRDLRRRGLDVYVAVDAVTSRRDEDRAVGLDLCRRVGAIPTSVETIVFDWLAQAGTDTFRAISKLVR